MGESCVVVGEGVTPISDRASSGEKGVVSEDRRRRDEFKDESQDTEKDDQVMALARRRQRQCL